jgi:hypothetical protein
MSDTFDFDWHSTVSQHLHDYSHIWIFLGVFYVPIIQGLQNAPYLSKWRERKPIFVTIRTLWFLWNTALSLFSVIGCFYTAQGTFHSLFLTPNSCIWDTGSTAWLNRRIGQFHYYALVSKTIELGDTVFLAVMGKPISFLHWYHHLLTMIFCYFTLIDFRPYVSLGITLNLGVHAVMYAYYALSSIGRRLPRSIAQSITTIQTGQMVVIVGYSIYVFQKCDTTPMMYLAAYMYALYLWLFAQYFFGRYCNKKQKEI